MAPAPPSAPISIPAPPFPFKAGDAGAFDGFTAVEPNGMAGGATGLSGQSAADRPLVTPHTSPAKARQPNGSFSPNSPPSRAAPPPAHPSTPTGRTTTPPTTPPTTPAHAAQADAGGHEQLLRQFTVLVPPECLWHTEQPASQRHERGSGSRAIHALAEQTNKRDMLLLVVYKQVRANA